MAHKAVAEIQETGGKALYVEVDLADDESVATAARTVAEKFSALHVLVNNAAILRSGTIESGAWIPKLGARNRNRSPRLGPDYAALITAFETGRRCYCQPLIRGRISR